MSIVLRKPISLMTLVSVGPTAPGTQFIDLLAGGGSVALIVTSVSGAARISAGANDLALQIMSVDHKSVFETLDMQSIDQAVQGQESGVVFWPRSDLGGLGVVVQPTQVLALVCLLGAPALASGTVVYGS